MLGQLPTSLKIKGKDFAIRSDYRNIIRIFAAYNAEKLQDADKIYICLKRIYVDFDKIPHSWYKEAYTAAMEFIECKMKSDIPMPKVVDWEKDEQLIFAAVNKVAGQEIRALEYMHWWTFLGFYQNIDRDDIWGFILTIRQKKARHRKLEKHETEFYNANRSMCDIGKYKNKKEEAVAFADTLYAELAGKE